MYICDTGLANKLARLDIGALFENSIFQNLRMQGEINYYAKKSGVEIDFILDKKWAFEVKSMPQPSDLKKLQEMTASLDLEGFTIVSRNYTDLESCGYGFMIEKQGIKKGAS